MYKGSIIFGVDSFEVTVRTPIFEGKEAALLFCNTSRLSIQARPLGLILTGIGMSPTLLKDDEITVSNLKQEGLGKQTSMKQEGWGVKDLARHPEVQRGMYCMKNSVTAIPILKP